MGGRDLENIDQLKSYLADGPFASDLVIPLAGGSGNYTFRLHLNIPYNKQQSVILKHGKPYIPGAKSFAFDLARQKYEVSAMRQVKKWFPDSIVTTPEIHVFDEEESIIIMEDCGEDSRNLKQLLVEKALPLSVHSTIGTALGQFLAQLHAKGSNEKDALDFYEGNSQARVLSAWATYGRLISTLSGEDQTVLHLSNPPLDVSSGDLQAISKVAKSTTEAVHSSRETLLMGDFWPGNIIPVFEQEGEEFSVKKIYVLDWELVKPGFRGMDIGQFCAEIHQARTFYPTCQDHAQEVLLSFLKRYKECTEGDLVNIAQRAMVHVGAHLVAWTPRVWGKEGGKEKTREVVLQGVRYLVDGSSGERANIHASLVGELITNVS